MSQFLSADHLMFLIAHRALPNTSLVDGQVSSCFATSAHAADHVEPGWTSSTVAYGVHRFSRTTTGAARAELARRLVTDALVSDRLQARGA